MEKISYRVLSLRSRMEPLCSVKLGITADNADDGSDAELEQDKDPEELEQEAGVASTVSLSEELE